jgi:hypothetical protein
MPRAAPTFSSQVSREKDRHRKGDPDRKACPPSLSRGSPTSSRPCCLRTSPTAREWQCIAGVCAGVGHKLTCSGRRRCPRAAPLRANAAYFQPPPPWESACREIRQLVVTAKVEPEFAFVNAATVSSARPSWVSGLALPHAATLAAGTQHGNRTAGDQGAAWPPRLILLRLPARTLLCALPGPRPAAAPACCTQGTDLPGPWEAFDQDAPRGACVQLVRKQAREPWEGAMQCTSGAGPRRDGVRTTSTASGAHLPVAAAAAG